MALPDSASGNIMISMRVSSTSRNGIRVTAVSTDDLQAPPSAGPQAHGDPIT
jgi:hypothetical protein